MDKIESILYGILIFLIIVILVEFILFAYATYELYQFKHCYNYDFRLNYCERYRRF